MEKIVINGLNEFINETCLGIVGLHEYLLILLSYNLGGSYISGCFHEYGPRTVVIMDLKFIFLANSATHSNNQATSTSKLCDNPDVWRKYMV